MEYGYIVSIYNRYYKEDDMELFQRSNSDYIDNIKSRELQERIVRGKE